MNRRRVLQFAIGVGVASGALPLRAQQAPAANIRRVGVLAPSTRAKEEVTLKPFFEEMRRLGWIEGQTIAYDRTYADDRHKDLPRLAAELVAHKPELIYAPPQIAATAAATRRVIRKSLVFGVLCLIAFGGGACDLSTMGCLPAAITATGHGDGHRHGEVCAT